MRGDKDEALERVLDSVLFDGWTQDAIEQADAAAFFCTINEVIEAFHTRIDTATEQAAKANPAFSSLKIREKIAFLVETRLTLLTPYKPIMRSLQAFLLTKRGGLPLATRAITRTADSMWHLAGDRSTDFNYYTKRGLLSLVYASSFQYWLNDTSPNMTDTQHFIRRRIDNVMGFGKAVQRVKQFMQKAS